MIVTQEYMLAGISVFINLKFYFEQVLSRHAEGPLQENVEDIIARYRNERRDLFDRFQPDNEMLPDKV